MLTDGNETPDDPDLASPSDSTRPQVKEHSYRKDGLLEASASSMQDVVAKEPSPREEVTQYAANKVISNDPSRKTYAEDSDVKVQAVPLLKQIPERNRKKLELKNGKVQLQATKNRKLENARSVEIPISKKNVIKVKPMSNLRRLLQKSEAKGVNGKSTQSVS